MQKLLDMLEDNDDVQEVWHNWENARRRAELDLAQIPLRPAGKKRGGEDMKNALREKMLANQTVLGTFALLGPKPGAECLALGGMDFMIVDTEHGPFDVETAIDYVVAAERHGITPLVRVKDPSRASVLKMLDIGAKGLIIPLWKRSKT